MQDKLNQAKATAFSLVKALLKRSKEATKAVESSGCFGKVKGLVNSTCDIAAKKIAEKTQKAAPAVQDKAETSVQNTADKTDE